MNLYTSWDSQLPPKTFTISDPHMYPHNLTDGGGGGGGDGGNDDWRKNTTPK
jgi:hypothetical protein